MQFHEELYLKPVCTALRWADRTVASVNELREKNASAAKDAGALTCNVQHYVVCR
jgi:hypothetical protein